MTVWIGVFQIGGVFGARSDKTSKCAIQYYERKPSSNDVYGYDGLSEWIYCRGFVFFFFFYAAIILLYIYFTISLYYYITIYLYLFLTIYLYISPCTIFKIISPSALKICRHLCPSLSQNPLHRTTEQSIWSWLLQHEYLLNIWVLRVTPIINNCNMKNRF